MPVHLVQLSRRRFMEASVSFCPALALSGVASAADDSVDPHTFALLADTHIAPLDAFGSKGEQSKGRATKLLPNMRSVVQDIGSLRPRPAGMILNGDCVEFGSTEDYRLFLSTISDLTTNGLPIHLTLGNHDHRPHFLEAIPRTHGVRAISEVPDRLVSVVKRERANWFLLDSLLMGQVAGELGREQLAWLARALDDHPDKPAIVVAHHNVHPGKEPRWKTETIVRCIAPVFNLDNGLLDSREFLEVLFARRHVKACFCGHKHQLSVHRIQGVYFVFQPAVAYPFQAADAVGWLRMSLLDDGAELQMRSLDPSHRHHLKKLQMRWS